MGLDWLVAPKPKDGMEVEFERLRREIDSNLRAPRWGLWSRLFRRRAARAEREAECQRLLELLDEVSVSHADTLRAPRIGQNAEADAWLRETLESQGRQSEVDDCLAELKGCPILEVLPGCDGLPKFSNGGAGLGLDLSSFRGAVLREVEDVIGAVLFESAHENKTADELVALGEELMVLAETYMREHDLSPPFDTFEHDDFDVNTSEFRADILLSAARWCLFWGRRGHGMDAWW